MNGRIIRNLQLSYGYISETEHSPSIVPRHAHDLASFCFVTHGTFRESTSRAESVFGKSDVIFRRPGEIHANRFDRGVRCLNVLFDPSLLVRTESGAPANLRGASTILRRLLQESRSAESLLVIEGLLLQLVGEVFRPPAARRSLVAEAARIVEERFAEPLTVRGIAEELSVHPVHLSRSFRQARGEGIGETIRALRIRHAMNLLRDRRMPLAEIALASGFVDQSHFTRVFREVVGATPGEYRSAPQAGEGTPTRREIAEPSPPRQRGRRWPKAG